MTHKTGQRKTPAQLLLHVEDELMRLLEKLIDVFRSPCPSGLKHRQRGQMVMNEKGNFFCWHPDCIRASHADANSEIAQQLLESLVRLQKRPGVSHIGD